MESDFSGWATKNDLRCADGLTIKHGAFTDNDGTRVPLVWQHGHNDPQNVLGHMILENRPQGVYAYGFFNETDKAQDAKMAVQHGDINALSIFANKLIKRGANVIHGAIREVSLVLAGANPGALIDFVQLKHGDLYETHDDEATIYTGLSLEHADNQGDNMSTANDLTVKDVFDSMTDEQQEVTHFLIGEALNGDSGDSAAHAEGDDDSDSDSGSVGGKTVKDVFNSLNEEQKNVVYFLIGEAAGDSDDDDSAAQSLQDSNYIQHAIQEGFSNMGFNVFENQGRNAERATLSHDQVQTIVRDGVKMGSIKESFLAHAGEYGITDIDILFPDAKTVGATPELLARQAEWVPKVLGATKHAPFAKIKSIVADLTAAEARAKGYIKGNEKKEEVIKLLRRTTGPTTVYKKQKLDRDDILDITDFDVITWLKWEIRFMLNEELARAILIGDGRESISDDKIKDPEGAVDGTGIRSILNDNPLYAHPLVLTANSNASMIVDEVSRGRTFYRGSGTPTFYTTDKVLTDLLLQKDKMGRRLYETEAALAAALRVKEIVAVEVLEETPNVIGIMVNLIDYTVGSNKGGELSFFEDFDIDFNQNKYLLETRISGALTKPKSAIVITREQGTEVTPGAPSFDGATNTITVPTTAGVNYLINDTVVTGDQEISEDTEINAEAASGYYFPSNSTTSWAFTYVAP